MQFTLLPALLFIFSFSAIAQQTKPPELKSLCALVDSRLELDDVEKKKYKHMIRYKFEEKIYKLANVNAGVDSPDIVKTKIQQFWKKYEPHLNCDALSFNVPKGSLIKFAVSRNFDNFIDDVIEWGVPLNTIDASDNRTVLDYVAQERDKQKGSALEAVYNRYFKKLRNAGARYSSEL